MLQRPHLSFRQRHTRYTPAGERTKAWRVEAYLMREMIRGVILALVALALLVGCLLLFAGVGVWRVTRNGVRVAEQPVPVAAAAPAGPNPTRIAATKPAPRVASTVIAATPIAPTSLAAEPPHRAAPAGGQARASLLRVDDDSAGGWVGRYGKKGYSLAIAGQPTSLPPGVLMSMNHSHLYIWSPVTTDRRGLSIPANPPQFSIGQWFSWDQFSLDLDLRGRGEDFQVALYLLDWDSDARAQRLDVTDAETGAVLLSRSDEHFKKGRYLLLRLSGHVALRFTKTAGANCTLSGVFLDSPPAAAE